MKIQSLSSLKNNLQVNKNVKSVSTGQQVVFAKRNDQNLENSGLLMPLAIASFLVAALSFTIKSCTKNVDAGSLVQKVQETAEPEQRRLNIQEAISLVKNQLAKILLEGALHEEEMIREFAKKTNLPEEHDEKVKLSPEHKKELNEIIAELDKAREAINVISLTPQFIQELDTNIPGKIAVAAFEEYTAGSANQRFYHFIDNLLKKEAGPDRDFANVQPAVQDLITGFDDSGLKVFEKLYGPVSLLELYTRQNNGSKDDGGWDLKALSNYIQITAPGTTVE